VVGAVSSVGIGSSADIGVSCFVGSWIFQGLMIYSIIATGSSAQDFIPRGHVIGCNDAARWGKQLNSLVVCNRPQQFSKERYEIIRATKCETFYSHKSAWKAEFPGWKKINLVPWYGTYNRGQIYSSNTSPIIAVTLAAKIGAKEIIMWGVDMMNHHLFNTGNHQTKKEVDIYLQLHEQLKENDIRLWLGNTGTAFDNVIPVWKD
jgi:hypothetical protein